MDDCSKSMQIRSIDQNNQGIEGHTNRKSTPGQKGTKRLVEQYGDALICVSYRYDKKRGICLKTV
jgi:hypothetical protein